MTFAAIVIPAYNAEATIKEALASALSQTHDAYEVIVVDDGSTDATAQIVEAVQDPRLRLIRQRNGGLNAARNAGIRAARGAYIGLLDADDLWAPDKLARHVAHLDANPDVGLSFSASCLLDAAGRPTGLRQSPKTHGVSARDLICHNPVGNGSTPVLRRAALDDIAYWVSGEEPARWFDEDLRRSTDIECWLRLALTTDWIIEGLAEPLTGYRINPDGLSANVMRQYESWLQMLRKIARVAPDFVAEHGAHARACQLRYLARRAISLRQPGLAWAFARGAFDNSPRILLDQPLKTLTTFGAAATLRWGGAPVYGAAERCLLGLMSLGRRAPAKF